MNKLKAVWTREQVEDLKAFHGIDVEAELTYHLFFEFLKETQKHFGRESLFKKYIKNLFIEFGATIPEDDELNNFDLILEKFVKTKTINKAFIFPTYEDFKKETILNRIKA